MKKKEEEEKKPPQLIDPTAVCTPVLFLLPLVSWGRHSPVWRRSRSMLNTFSRAGAASKFGCLNNSRRPSHPRIYLFIELRPFYLLTEEEEEDEMLMRVMGGTESSTSSSSFLAPIHFTFRRNACRDVCHGRRIALFLSSFQPLIFLFFLGFESFVGSKLPYAMRDVINHFRPHFFSPSTSWKIKYQGIKSERFDLYCDSCRNDRIKGRRKFIFFSLPGSHFKQLMPRHGRLFKCSI